MMIGRQLNIHKSNVVGFLEVSFETPKDIKYPILPSKGSLTRRQPPKLLFCVGKGKGIYYRLEIEIAIKYGYKIKSIIRAVLFEGGYPLRNYSQILMNAKDKSKSENDKVSTLIYKLINNNIYGKFAINISRTRGFATLKEIVELRDLVTHHEFDDGIGLYIQEARSDKPIRGARSTNVAIASAIRS